MLYRTLRRYINTIIIILFIICCDVDCVSGETLIGQRSVCGVLMVLAGMLKHGKRDDLNDFGNVFIVAALCNRAGHYIFAVWFLSSFFPSIFFSFLA